jgi:hypothetical protein
MVLRFIYVPSLENIRFFLSVFTHTDSDWYQQDRKIMIKKIKITSRHVKIGFQISYLLNVKITLTHSSLQSACTLHGAIRTLIH